MKKLYPTVIALIFILLTGCSLEKTTPEDTVLEDAVLKEEKQTYQASQEILDTDLFASKIQIDDTVLYFGETLGTWLDKLGNWSLEPNTSNKKFPASTGGSVSILNEENTNLRLFVYNEPEKDIPIEDTVVVFVFEVSDELKGRIFYEKGITIGMNYDEIINLCGTPTAEDKDKNGRILLRYVQPIEYNSHYTRREIQFYFDNQTKICNGIYYGFEESGISSNVLHEIWNKSYGD